MADSAKRGIQKGTMEDLFSEYDHIAVFRQPDCWSEGRRNRLIDFVESCIARKAKFNFEGIRSFEEAHGAHQIELMEKISDFFDGNFAAPEAERDAYFCSEFVAACIVAVGILSPSATVVYDPKVISPGDLGNDATYGHFVGYLIRDDGYVVPSDDEFIARQPLHEWL